MKTRQTLGVVLALAGAVGMGPSDSRLQERERVDYVLLDVLAFDRDGRPVTDLTIDDFDVRENRKKVRLESLEVYDWRGVGTEADRPTPAEASPSGAVRSARLILVTDLRWAREAQARKTFDELERFLADVPVDEGVVYQFFSLKEGLMMDNFSHDPGRVAAAVRRLRKSAGHDGDFGLQDGEGVDDLTAFEQRLDSCRLLGDTTRGTALVPGRPPEGRGLSRCIHEELRAYVASLELRTEQAIDELEALPARFSDGSAPVSFLFVSPGFSLEPGRAAHELARIYLDRSRRVDDPWADEEPPPAPTQTLSSIGSVRSFEDRFRDVIDACLRHRATFHTFAIFNFNLGVERKVEARLTHGSNRVVGAHRTFKAELNRGLIELAGQSGGFYHSGATLKPMRSVVERSRFVYTLGYASPNDKPGKFRNIKVKCRRSGVELRHRSGYYRD